MKDVQRIPTRDVILVVLGAAVAVVLAVVFAHEARDVWAPAIAIAVVVVIAELSLEAARRRNDEMVGALARSAAEPAATEGHAPAPASNGVTPKATVSAVPTPFRQFRADDRRQDDPQCPSCGRFLVDVVSLQVQSFRCRACGTRWEWQRGLPWPDVFVVPDLRELPGDRSAGR